MFSNLFITFKWIWHKSQLWMLSPATGCACSGADKTTECWVYLNVQVLTAVQDLSCLSLWQVRLRNDRWDWGNFLQISYAFTKIGTFSSNKLYFKNIFTRNDRWESRPVQRPGVQFLSLWGVFLDVGIFNGILL